MSRRNRRYSAYPYQTPAQRPQLQPQPQPPIEMSVRLTALCHRIRDVPDSHEHRQTLLALKSLLIAAERRVTKETHPIIKGVFQNQLVPLFTAADNILLEVFPVPQAENED